MSMIQLEGQLINLFNATNREGEEKDKIQILGEYVLPNGQTKNDLMTITVNDLRKYQEMEGQKVTVPVGCFAPQKGSVIFFEAR